MHFITGGAFNGKRKWVKKHYNMGESLWLSAYNADSITESSNVNIPAMVVLEGIEKWIHAQIDLDILPDVQRQNVMEQIKPWLNWEWEDSHRTLVIIGTDISKGIVPIDKEDRLWRDITGWVYQDLVEQAERAHIIWYGIEQTLK